MDRLPIGLWTFCQKIIEPIEKENKSLKAMILWLQSGEYTRENYSKNFNY